MGRGGSCTHAHTCARACMRVCMCLCIYISEAAVTVHIHGIAKLIMSFDKRQNVIQQS